MILWLGRSMSDGGRKRNYYIVYTIFFLIMTFFCYSYFILSDTSLIWENDGWDQYYRALVYYSQYLRNIIKNLIENHKLIIPGWDFYIGEGADIVNTLHYYVIGDPLALFSALVPVDYMHYYFSLFSILRMYLAGITFSVLCFGTGKSNRLAVLTGALSYAFCFWALYNSARHPYFINPMVYFPLVILGMEKIINKEKPYLFSVAVAISAACSFYFFYMTVVLSVIYVIFRLGFLYKNNIRQWMDTLLRLGFMAIVGVCMAGIILLPMIMVFMSDTRMSSVQQPFHWLYPLFYYSGLPGIVVSNYDVGGYYWFIMGYTPLAVISLFLLFIQKRKNILLKVLVITCIVITLLPICGRILNGMAYMSNRWSWAFALLSMYVLVSVWGGGTGNFAAIESGVF